MGWDHKKKDKWNTTSSFCFLSNEFDVLHFQVVLSAILGLALGQNNYRGDPRTAAIVAEQRYLGGDGRFGATYTQEDGVNFKEESEPDGTRRGSYSYVDPNGQR